MFSKVAVFFEGETEEQALPIFAKKHFAIQHSDLGIDFIGVGGYGNYKPFIRLADSLMIPWYILSDAENTPEKNVKSSVQSQFADCTSGKSEGDHIVFLNDGNGFEKQLLDDGYEKEIKEAIISIELPLCNSPQHQEAKKSEIEGLSLDEIYTRLTRSKTQYGPAVAEKISESSKGLPACVIDLFEKVEQTLKQKE